MSITEANFFRFQFPIFENNNKFLLFRFLTRKKEKKMDCKECSSLFDVIFYPSVSVLVLFITDFPDDPFNILFSIQIISLSHFHWK